MADQNQKKQPIPPPKNPNRNNLTWFFLLFFLALIAILVFQQNSSKQKNEKTISQLYEDLAADKVSSVNQYRESVEWENKDSSKNFANLIAPDLDPQIKALIFLKLDKGKFIYDQKPPNAMAQFFASPLPW